MVFKFVFHAIRLKGSESFLNSQEMSEKFTRVPQKT